MYLTLKKYILLTVIYNNMDKYAEFSKKISYSFWLINLSSLYVAIIL